MNTRPTAVATSLLAAAALPAAASGAQIHADRACYEDAHGSVVITGSGFEPDQPYQVTLDGRPLADGTGTTDAAGGISRALPTPQLGAGRAHAYTVGVVQGANMPTARFSVTPFTADFAPSSGSPRTLRVRFTVAGFALVDPHPTVYLHYVRPNGRLKRTVRLGRAQGACGDIRRTSRRKLFPFHAGPGRWRLQFDTHRRYRKGVTGADFLYNTIGVTVRRVFG